MGKEKKKKSKKRHYEVDEDSPTNMDKKEAKKLRKQAEKVAKTFGYTNDTNPFGDSNLLQPFVWGKKKEKEKKEGKERKNDDESRLRLMKDIDRVRKRRIERENELEEMERLRAEEQRLREASLYDNWEEKEEEFHKQQTKVRSKIRLIEGREKPIDVLARIILLIESFNSKEKEDKEFGSNLAGLHDKLADPLTVIQELENDDLSQLQHDIGKYLEIETKNEGAYIDFWKALRHVVSFDLHRRNHIMSGLHKSVMSDVQSLIGGKNSSELKHLLDDIRKDVREGRRTDIEYWEQMEKEVDVEHSRAIVREIHSDLQSQQQAIIAHYEAEEEIRRKERADQTQGGKSEGSTSPEYRFISSSSSKVQRGVVDERGEDYSKVDNSTEAVAWLQGEQNKDMDSNEEAMPSRDEVALNRKVYRWKDKYRPRKPRYFNVVRTGFEWNKYNATHYDHDNPPPKIVQGYKFNIFYPDLIDKTQTPKYFLEAADEPEFAILRFHAGPPYEDVAFKIVNQEWYIGKASGFRCVFERGVLQLHFNYKRRIYKR